MLKCKISSIRGIGVRPTCNVTMKSDSHNYAIFDPSINCRIYTRNSHACSYAYESFKTAYLKAHYRLEFMSARLTVEAIRRNFDDVEKYEADCIKSGIRILPPDLNKSKLKYIIVDEKTLRRPLLIKGVGDKAAEEIVKNQPYKGSDLFRAFAMKVGSSVNTKVLEVLHADKLFGNIKKKDMLVMFERIRNARRRHKGEQTRDLF